MTNVKLTDEQARDVIRAQARQVVEVLGPDGSGSWGDDTTFDGIRSTIDVLEALYEAYVKGDSFEVGVSELLNTKGALTNMRAWSDHEVAPAIEALNSPATVKGE